MNTISIAIIIISSSIFLYISFVLLGFLLKGKNLKAQDLDSK